MMERLVDYLLLRSRREKVLLAVLTLLVAPLAVYLLVVQPLQANRADSVVAVSEAAALNTWVKARVVDYGALTPATATLDGAVAAIGASGIEQSLRTAGLRDRIDRLAARSGGEIALGFDAVPFSELAAWMSDTLQQAGYVIASFRMTRGEDAGIVAADIVLQPVDG